MDAIYATPLYALVTLTVGQDTRTWKSPIFRVEEEGN